MFTVGDSLPPCNLVVGCDYSSSVQRATFSSARLHWNTAITGQERSLVMIQCFGLHGAASCGHRMEE